MFRLKVNVSISLNRNGESACVSETVRERGICLFFTQSLTHFLITSANCRKKAADTVIYWSLISAPNNKRAVNQLCYCKLKRRRNDLEVYTAPWLICVVHNDTQAVKKCFLWLQGKWCRNWQYGYSRSFFNLHSRNMVTIKISSVKEDKENVSLIKGSFLLFYF